MRAAGDARRLGRFTVTPWLTKANGFGKRQGLAAEACSQRVKRRAPLVSKYDLHSNTHLYLNAKLNLSGADVKFVHDTKTIDPRTEQGSDAPASARCCLDHLHEEGIRRGERGRHRCRGWLHARRVLFEFPRQAGGAA